MAAHFEVRPSVHTYNMQTYVCVCRYGARPSLKWMDCLVAPLTLPYTYHHHHDQVRQRNLDGARRILGQAIGRCSGKEKLFKARFRVYICVSVTAPHQLTH